jgi:hypothetical protein
VSEANRQPDRRNYPIQALVSLKGLAAAIQVAFGKLADS